MDSNKIWRHMKAENVVMPATPLFREVIQQAKPDLEDAIKKMFNNTGEFPKCLNMAYLGCSVGFIVYERSVNEKMGSKMVEEKETIKWKVYSQIRKFILSPTLVEEENLKVFIIKNTYSTWQVRQEIIDASRRRCRRSLDLGFVDR
ncbi:putative protein isoform X1 [Capsicum annuum]